VEDAKEQLKRFFMGKHLPHAPQEYLKTMTLTSLFTLWRETDKRMIPYKYHIGRGICILKFIHYIFFTFKYIENLRKVHGTGVYTSAKAFAAAGSTIVAGKV
jgi:hypothetical protein